MKRNLNQSNRIMYINRSIAMLNTLHRIGVSSVAAGALALLAGACTGELDEGVPDDVAEVSQKEVQKTLSCRDIGYFPTYTFWGITKVQFTSSQPTSGTVLDVSWEAGLSGNHTQPVESSPVNFEGKWAGATLEVRYHGFTDAVGVYHDCVFPNGLTPPQLSVRTW
jgi:hypothetical protein